MAKINQTNDPTVDDGSASATARRRTENGRILSHTEISDVMGRARRMQARAIASLFTNLGK